MSAKETSGSDNGVGASTMFAFCPHQFFDDLHELKILHRLRSRG